MNSSILPRNELRISITSLCNMSCVYCHNEGNYEAASLSVRLIKKLVLAAQKFQLKSVRLTGGEPLLHKDIEEICKVIKEIDANIQIGINTNGILIDKLLDLVDKGYIDRVVVGIDYYDAAVSKNSEVGLSSAQILKHLLMLKDKDVKLEISKTFNNDLDNTIKLTEWAINHDIPIKIIEIVDQETSTTSQESYLQMKSELIKRFSLDIVKNELLNEDYGFINNKKMVSFFQSHCRLRECSFCKNLHMRVMSDQKFKPCLLNKDTEVAFTEDNIVASLEESLKYLGVPPKDK